MAFTSFGDNLDALRLMAIRSEQTFFGRSLEYSNPERSAAAAASRSLVSRG
ncbi:hypothetical protein [Ideonella sp. B508-1]|uniref:hypothetical protein n=1 Tax=Ideonella sp. B508-1 TaxID=137716 RepID=UPI001F42A2E1|nr:hypothetical protein [Ideonella sp. B508-1]